MTFCMLIGIEIVSSPGSKLQWGCSLGTGSWKGILCVCDLVEAILVLEHH